MALALADSIASVGWDLNDQARRYLAWYDKGWYSVNSRSSIPFTIGVPPCKLLIEYEQSTGLVREVYDDIRVTRKTDDINNFWKGIAHHPPTLQRTWTMLKEVMGGPGELDPLVRAD